MRRGRKRRGSNASDASDLSEASVASFASNRSAARLARHLARRTEEKQCPKELLRSTVDPSTHPHRIKAQMRLERSAEMEEGEHTSREELERMTMDADQMMQHNKENSSFEEQRLRGVESRSAHEQELDTEETAVEDEIYDTPSGGRSARVSGMGFGLGQRRSRKTSPPPEAVLPREDRIRSWEDTLSRSYL